ncbi:MAG: hypothetical protein WDW38_010031 [Sanguina aurantia]
MAQGGVSSSSLFTRSFSSSVGIQYPPATARVGQMAPDFTAPAVVNGELSSLSLSDYKGKYAVLFFYPKDFTFVCPTEIIAFSDRAKEFEALGAYLIAASTDTEECHLAWIKTPRTRGGLGFMQIPIVADVTKEVSAKYGVLIESAGIALRGLFIINPQGIIQHITINDLPIGRNVDEALRLLQAIQFVAEHGEVCPANWTPGSKTMVAKPDESLNYFSEANAEEVDDFGLKLHSLKSRTEYDALLAKKGLVVIDFYASWCGKCRQIAPFVEDLQTKYPGVTFAKLDTSAPSLEAMSGELGVKVLPCFRFYKDGKQVHPEVCGYKKKLLEDAVAEIAK